MRRAFSAALFLLAASVASAQWVNMTTAWTQINVPSGGGDGGGSVTTVSVTTANGVSGVVGNPTTTPAITITLGAITPTTVNGNTLTTGTYTLSGAAGKTFTFSNTLTLAGTDGTTMTFPATSATIARTDAGNTFTGHQTIEGVTSTGATGTGKIVFDGSPVLATPNLGTPSAVVLTNATGLPCGAMPALTGDTTTSAGSCATSVVKVNGNAPTTAGVTDKYVSALDSSARGTLTMLPVRTLATVTTSGSQATVDFNSLPGTCGAIIVLYQVRSTVSATQDTMFVKINNDGTAANYIATTNLTGNASTAASTATAASTSGAPVNAVSGATATAGVVGSGTLMIPNYAATTFMKSFTANGGFVAVAGTTTATAQETQGWWKTTGSAITRLTFSNAGGNFVDGSYFLVEGHGCS